MRAVVFQGPGAFSVETVPEPVPEPDSVLLRTVVTGMCGSDMHLLAGHIDVAYPIIPGHEIIAQVEELGSDVTDLRVGDLVAVDNTRFCEQCTHCRAGHHLYCERFYSLGRDGPGGFAEMLMAQSSKCFRLGDLHPSVAVLVEPLACAIHGLDRLDMVNGADVLVLGAGPSGLLLAQLLRSGGASRVTVAAPSLHKLELARSYGIDETIQLDRADPQGALRSLRDVAPNGFDAVVEATGAPGPLQLALQLTKIGGTVLVYGMLDSDIQLPFSPYDVFSREITIRGTFAQTHCFDRALRSLASGRVRTEGMIESVVPLARFADALDHLTDSRYTKVVVTPSGEF